MSNSQSSTNMMMPQDVGRMATFEPEHSTSLDSRFMKFLSACGPGALAISMVAAIVGLGIATNWRLPKRSALTSSIPPEVEDWCEEHSVPESQCVECTKGCMPRGPEFGWCKKHGVSECPLCHPEVAQLNDVPVVTSDDLERAERALTFAPRTANNSNCKSHQRRIQFVSDEVVQKLEIESEPVSEGAITEAVTANGEVSFDPTRTARVAARSPGILWRIERQTGDRIRHGDLLALIDSADVGQAKHAFQRSLFEVASKRQNLENVRAIAGAAVAAQRVIEAQAELEDAQVRLLAARQSLVNFGLPVAIADFEDLDPEELIARMKFLGIPFDTAQQLASQTASSNLLPIVSPLEGEILHRAGTPGEMVDASDVLFVVADTSRVWLTLHVRLEDAERVAAGQIVRFTHQGHHDWDDGRVVWVSPAADERTRTVPVRVELKNVRDRHQARTFGTGRIVLREEPRALVVPSSAIHWDGDCHVVFVRDRDYERPESPKVFHVRKVRPGAKDVIGSRPVTEIAVGVLPGEWVASANSGILRSELLKNNLGAG